MPGKVRVKIIAGRNLPVMDRSNDSADAYVEIKLANVTYKTDVYRKSLNPQWNTDFYRFELDDAELQDEPLQIRLMDHDTYTANDAIGKVSISLNPLLLPSSSLIGGGCGVGGQTTIVSEKGAVMAGWIPVFDTMHGIRGEVNVVVKVDLFSDVNKFRQSSCGVQFFHSPNIPHGYHAQIVHGFVEELVVNDDPEYQWIDKIRTPRASNDARQLVFLRLSGQVQRKIGLKAIDLGANAVIGYTQCFDLEGDVGVVARGIGTAVTLERNPSMALAMTAGGAFTDEQLKNLKFFQQFDRLHPSAADDRFTDNPIVVDTHQQQPFDSISAAGICNEPPAMPCNADGTGGYFMASDETTSTTMAANAETAATRFACSCSTLLLFDGDGIGHLADAAGTIRSPSAGGGSSAESIAHLKQLLDQEDGRGQKSASVLRRRMQHIGKTSRNVLARISRRKSREDLQIGRSLSESLSELSLYASSSVGKLSRSSNGSKKSRLGRRGSRRASAAEGSGMAALLVSSMLAAPSLNCIKETANADGEEDGGDGTEMQRPAAAFVPARPSIKQSRPPPIQSSQSVSFGNLVSAAAASSSASMAAATVSGSSLNNVSASHRSVMSSVTSLTSMSSISELDDNDAGDEDSESGSAANKSLTLLGDGTAAALETVSMVVESVLALERREAEERLQKLQLEQINAAEQSVAAYCSIAARHQSPQPQPLSLHLSALAPSTSNLPISQTRHFNTALLPSYLQPKADNESEIWIQPGSTVDEPEINDSRRESMFHDLKENIFDTMHTLQDTINAVGYATGHGSTAHDDHLFQMAIAQMMREQTAIMGAPVDCVVRDKPVAAVASSIGEASSTCESSGSTTAAVVGAQPTTHSRTPSVRLKALRKRITSFCTRATSPALVSLRTMLPRRLRTRSESDSKRSRTAVSSPTAQSPLAGGKALSLSPKTTIRMRTITEPTPTTTLTAAALAAAGSYGSTIDLTGMKMTRIKPFISLSDLSQSQSHEHCADIGSSSPTTPSTIIDTNTAVLLAPLSTPHPFTSSSPSTTTQQTLLISQPNSPSNNATFALPSTSSSSSSTSSSSSSCHHHSPLAPCVQSDRAAAAANSTAASGQTTGKQLNSGATASTTTAAKDIGHVRAESSAVAPLTASTTAAEREAAAVALQCRRSSDSDLAVTPKGTHEVSSSQPQAPHQSQPAQHQSNAQQHQSHNQHNHHHHPQQQQHHRHHNQQQHHHHHHQRGHHQHQHQPQIMHLPPPIYNARASSTKLKLRQLHPDSLDMLEYPFLTLTKYPIGFILNIGATVCARSVKLLERVPNPDEPETRDSWWKELRMEIRSHARTLGCNVILGYSETTSISDEVCVLSATGTAAIINVSPSSNEFGLLNSSAPASKKTSTVQQQQHTTSANNNNNNNNNDDNATGGSIDPSNVATATINSPQKNGSNNGDQSNSGGAGATNSGTNSLTADSMARPAVSAHNADCANCSLCHIPYNRASAPFHAHMKRCQLCRNANVPDVLLATIELPDALPLTGRGCFLQAQVCRTKKDLKSESNAKEISDCLPFLEYDLHRLLINKLKMKGMNAIFGLKSTVTIGEKVIALIATGTAVFVPALTPPTLPKIVAGNSWTNTEKLQEFQRALQETVDRNREAYQLKSLSELEAVDSGPDESCDEDASRSPDMQQKVSGSSGANALPLSGSNAGAGGGNKGTFVLEVDDIEDLEIIALLMESCPPDGFYVVNTETVPGVPLHQPPQIVRNLQMFTQIWRAKLGAAAPGNHHNHNQGSNFARHFQRLLQTIFFKLRTMLPCAICNLQFSLALPDTDEIQLLVTGMAIGLCDTSKMLKKLTIQDRDEELIFNMEGEHQLQSSYNQPQYSVDQQQQRSIRSPGHHLVQTGSLKVNPSAHTEQHRKFAAASRIGRERYGVELTPLSYVPGGNVQKYLGNLNFFFIRESTSIRESGGVSGFVHSFITEMLAVVRAHVTALGGNALVSFYMTELELVDNPHKNQGQCLISVGGDVVFVSYYAGE